MRKLLTAILLMSIIIPLSISTIQAQPAPFIDERSLDEISGPPDYIPPPPRERYRTIQMWKLTEVLSLTEEQAAKFFPMLNNFENQIEEIRNQNRELYGKLRAYIQIDEKKKILNTIEQIESNEENILKLRKDFRKDASKVLNDIQIGKLVCFQYDFPRKFRNTMWNIRGRGPERGRSGRIGPGTGPGWKDGSQNFRMMGMRSGAGWGLGLSGLNPYCPYR